MATGRLANPVQLGASTDTTVYTVPVGYYSVFNVSITNVGTSPITIRIAMATTTTPNIEEWIEYDVTIVAKGVFERTGLVGNAGLNIVAWADTGSAANVTVYGIETSTA
jgi:hypothetical protein